MKNDNNCRILATTHKLWIENKKTLLIATCAYWGLFILIGAWIGMLGGSPSEVDMVLYIMFAGLICALTASMTFSDLKNKEGRISTLMLPASPSDKFIPRLIGGVLGTLIIVFIGYFILEYSQIVAHYLAHNSIADIYLPTSHLGGREIISLAMIVSIFLFNESLFIFGAIAWPRKSFLKTLGIFLAIWIVLSLLIGITIKNASNVVIMINETAVCWIFTGITALVSISIVYAAFIKFKRTTVI